MLWFFTHAKVYKRSQIIMVCRTFFNELKEKYFKTALLILGEKAYSICYKGTQTQATYLCIVIITVTQSYGHKNKEKTLSKVPASFVIDVNCFYALFSFLAFQLILEWPQLCICYLLLGISLKFYNI